MKAHRKTAERLPIGGTFNVRDMGGYSAAGGRTVRWNRVFRSDDLSTVTNDGLDYLARLEIRSIVDFRDIEEREYAPDRCPDCISGIYEFPIKVGNLMELLELNNYDAGLLLRNANKSLVRDFNAEYASFFEVLANGDSAPLLFHCSAGKDRAGFAAALFLSSLGVDRETVIQDYLPSGDNIRPKYQAEVEANPVLAPLMQSRREYLSSAFEVIDDEFGGVENYLAEVLGVDLERMRSLYLD